MVGMMQLIMNAITITSKLWQNYRHLISDTVFPYSWSVMIDEAANNLAGKMGKLAHSKSSDVIENLKIVLFSLNLKTSLYKYFFHLCYSNLNRIQFVKYEKR